MSINAADILRQLQEAASEVRAGKLDAESAMAVAALGGKQVEVLRTMVDYLKVTKDQQLTDISTDVFVGTENPQRVLTNGSHPR